MKLHGLLALSTFSRSIVLASSFLTTIILARFLGPSDLAVYNLLLSIAGISSILFISPIGLFLNRFCYDLKRLKVLRTISILLSIYVAFIALITLVFTKFYYFGSLEDVANYFSIVIFFIGYYWATNLMQTYLSLLNVLNFQKLFSLLSVFTATSVLGIPCMMIFLLNKDLMIWIYGGATASILNLIFIYNIYSKKNDYNYNSLRIFKSIKLIFHEFKIIQFSLPLLISGGSTFIIFNLFRFMGPLIMPLENFGKFVAIYALAAGMIGLVEQIIIVSLQPKIIESSSSSENENIAKFWCGYQSIIICFIGIIIVLGTVHSNSIIVLIFGQSYMEMGHLLKIALLIEGCRVTINSIAFYLQLLKKTYINLILSVLILLSLSVIFFLTRDALNLINLLNKTVIITSTSIICTLLFFSLRGWINFKTLKSLIVLQIIPLIFVSLFLNSFESLETYTYQIFAELLWVSISLLLLLYSSNTKFLLEKVSGIGQ